MDFDNRELTVNTPEHVRLQFKTAGIGSRAGAQLIDILILLAINTLLILSGMALFIIDGIEMLLADYILAIMIIGFFLINGGYFVFLEYYLGHTLGKKVFHLRVIQENGQSLTFLSSIIRNFFRLLDMMPSGYFVGAIVSFFHPKDKRIGDLVAGTVVIVEEDKGRLKRKQGIDVTLREAAPYMPQLRIDEFNKQYMTDKDWQILNALIERWGTLTKQKRHELAHKVANHFVHKLPVLEEQIKRDGRGLIIQPELIVLALYAQFREDWEI